MRLQSSHHLIIYYFKAPWYFSIYSHDYSVVILCFLCVCILGVSIFRLAKEKVNYEKEVEKQQAKMDSIRLADPDDYALKKEVLVFAYYSRINPRVLGQQPRNNTNLCTPVFLKYIFRVLEST